MDWEFYILNYLQNHIRSDFLDKLMPAISLLGTGGALFIILCLAALFSKKHRRLGKLILCDLLLNLICCLLIIKPIVSRLRPYQLNSHIQLLVSPEIDASFPSGHTLFSFGAATVCFYYNKKLGIVMYIVALCIAFSRLYLYVHFPTDVLAGMIFGILFGLLAIFFEKRIFEQKHLGVSLEQNSSRQEENE